MFDTFEKLRISKSFVYRKIKLYNDSNTMITKELNIHGQSELVELFEQLKPEFGEILSISRRRRPYQE